MSVSKFSFAHFKQKSIQQTQMQFYVNSTSRESLLVLYRVDYL